jgi:hypothetical protein
MLLPVCAAVHNTGTGTFKEVPSLSVRLYGQVLVASESRVHLCVLLVVGQVR